MLDSHVSITYNMGLFKDTHAFRVFPSLSTDLILGLDWLIKNNPQIPDWSAGVIYLSQPGKNGKRKVVKVKSVVPAKPKAVIVEKEPAPVEKPPTQLPYGKESGLISALEVSETSDWECMICYLTPQQDMEFEEYLKPSFSEPPL